MSHDALLFDLPRKRQKTLPPWPSPFSGTQFPLSDSRCKQFLQKKLCQICHQNQGLVQAVNLSEPPGHQGPEQICDFWCLIFPPTFFGKYCTPFFWKCDVSLHVTGAMCLALGRYFLARTFRILYNRENFNKVSENCSKSTIPISWLQKTNLLRTGGGVSIAEPFKALEFKTSLHPPKHCLSCSCLSLRSSQASPSFGEWLLLWNVPKLLALSPSENTLDTKTNGNKKTHWFCHQHPNTRIRSQFTMISRHTIAASPLSSYKIETTSSCFPRRCRRPARNSTSATPLWI